MQTSSPDAQLSNKDRPAMSRLVALLFAVCSGLAVANIYYAQPLLDSIAQEFNLSPSSIGIVITVTQICYALGLFLLVPLGDLLNRRKLIIIQMLLSVLALILIGTAKSSSLLFTGMAVVGLLAVITQTLVAFAAHLAAPTERGRIVGQVTSGIVIGILLARTVAGTLNDWLGWRSVYLFSASFTLLGIVALYLVLPRQQSPQVKQSYVQLLNSVLQLYRELRVLRVRGVLAMLIFTAFSILWTSMVLPLSSPPLSLSHTLIGAFGLAGAAGAMAAARAGKLADRGLGQNNRYLSCHSALVLAAHRLCPSLVVVPDPRRYPARSRRASRTCYQPEPDLRSPSRSTEPPDGSVYDLLLHRQCNRLHRFYPGVCMGGLDSGLLVRCGC